MSHISNDAKSTGSLHAKALVAKKRMIELENEKCRISLAIKEQKLLLEETCPHKKTVRMIDDDFNRVRWFDECCLCGNVDWVRHGGH